MRFSWLISVVFAFADGCDHEMAFAANQSVARAAQDVAACALGAHLEGIPEANNKCASQIRNFMSTTLSLSIDPALKTFKPGQALSNERLEAIDARAVFWRVSMPNIAPAIDTFRGALRNACSQAKDASALAAGRQAAATGS